MCSDTSAQIANVNGVHSISQEHHTEDNIGERKHKHNITTDNYRRSQPLNALESFTGVVSPLQQE